MSPSAPLDSDAPTRTTLRLHPDDPVVVALRELGSGDPVEDGVTCRQAIPRGHKVATRGIGRGEVVRKFGQGIGRATRDIEAGEWVHTAELDADLGGQGGAVGGEVATATADWSVTSGVVADVGATFEGYRRADGRVGTRNVLGILTTVNCSAGVAKLLAREVERRGLLADAAHLDGVAALTHASGCGHVPDGEGLANLRRTLGGYARHPNFAGVLVIGLGCETNDIESLLADQALESSPRLDVLSIQAAGGTEGALEDGLRRLGRLVEASAGDVREQAPLAHLCLGLQCGGSDAFSALTANPVLGRVADRLVAAGGSVVLAETPEIYGAEQLLHDRVASPEVRRALDARLAWWRDHAAAGGGTLDNNPSPGNREGGLTTILEKSLGAVAKGGSSPLHGVLAYAGTVPGPGLWFMDSPGFDPASATGEIAGGANLLCFTTGRGSVAGFQPTPGLKLASTSDLARRLAGDIDFDCGPVLAGESLDDVAERLFRLVLDTASGRRTRSEAWGFGESEFVPWVPGPVF